MTEAYGWLFLLLGVVFVSCALFHWMESRRGKSIEEIRLKRMFMKANLLTALCCFTFGIVSIAMGAV